MLSNVFEVLVKQLDAFFEQSGSRMLHSSSGGSIDPTILLAASPGGDSDPSIKIMHLLQQGDQQESIQFTLNKVTPILINIEEENRLRPADRFSRVAANGNRAPIFPDIRLNLHILFVSHFYDYTDAMYYLGLVVKYFQSHPVLDHQNCPNLDPGTDKLVIELMTLPFAEQNEVWNALRTAYRPSLLYKVKMVVFQTAPAVMGAGEIKEVFSDLEDSKLS